MKTKLTWAVATMALFALGCPTPTNGPCEFDSDCGQGSRCCNGACRDVRTDVDNCGACGAKCPAVSGTAECVAGSCQIICQENRGNCDNDLSNGCESDLLVSKSHCGACGNACSAPNAAGACNSGVCAKGQCNSGFADCDLVASNGCEVSTEDTVAHCGACNNACALANASETCVAGVCAVQQCEPGFANCNNLAVDGCEIDTRIDEQHCGACGTVCTANQVCVTGTCRSQQVVGFGGQATQNTAPEAGLWSYDAAAKKYVSIDAMAPNGAPEERIGHFAMFDGPTSRYLLWGGVPASMTEDAALWALSFEGMTPTWSQVPQSGPQPDWRGLFCYGHDAATRTVWMTGGLNFASGQVYTDTWKLDLATATWTEVIADGAGPAPSTLFSACAFDEGTGMFVVYGGVDFPSVTTAKNELWLFDTKASTPGWTQVTPSGVTPGARSGAAFAEGSSPLRLFGGFRVDPNTNGAENFADVWTLNLMSPVQWTLETAASASGPSPRSSSAVASWNGKMLVFGGQEQGEFGDTLEAYDDLWEYDLTSKSWTLLIPDGSAEAPAGKIRATLTAPR